MGLARNIDSGACDAADSTQGCYLDSMKDWTQMDVCINSGLIVCGCHRNMSYKISARMFGNSQTAVKKPTRIVLGLTVFQTCF